ncbi:hypothetical protein IP65_17745 [Novosphingobium sp. AAP1]|nr:hypothetical protein IP65_17745 [Novosphingobium sp. AAP1]
MGNILRLGVLLLPMVRLRMGSQPVRHERHFPVFCLLCQSSDAIDVVVPSRTCASFKKAKNDGIRPTAENHALPVDALRCGICAVLKQEIQQIRTFDPIQWRSTKAVATVGISSMGQQPLSGFYAIRLPPLASVRSGQFSQCRLTLRTVRIIVRAALPANVDINSCVRCRVNQLR